MVENNKKLKEGLNENDNNFWEIKRKCFKKGTKRKKKGDILGEKRIIKLIDFSLIINYKF